MKNLLIIAFSFLVLQISGQTITSGEYIAVIGKASESYIPDMVTFNLSINAKDKKQLEAVKKMNDQSEKTINTISRLGYDTKEIKLSNYELGEDFDYSGDKPKNNGFKASVSFELEIKYTEESFNELIDSISSKKIPDLTFTYTSSFSNDFQRKIKNELIRKASDDAESVAKVLAKSRNVELGDIFSIEFTDNNFSLYGQGILPPPPPPMDVVADRMEAPRISKRISMMGIFNRQEVRIIYRIKK
jgi:uncharacterized protein YggE